MRCDLNSRATSTKIFFKFKVRPKKIDYLVKYLILTPVTKNWEGMGKIFPMSERSEWIGKIPIQAEATPKLRIGICEASEASIHKFAHTSKFFVTGVKINFFM